MNQLLLRFEMMDNAMADILRQKSEAERLRIAGRMWASARVMLRGPSVANIRIGMRPR